MKSKILLEKVSKTLDDLKMEILKFEVQEDTYDWHHFMKYQMADFNALRLMIKNARDLADEMLGCIEIGE